ncbi:MAG: dipeptidase [Caldilineaceae bacterium]|nr:dipeptidase [Caldilineaceae bacterium]
MTTQLTAYLLTEQPRQLQELMAWLRIPSISTISAHKADMVTAAQWLVTQMRQSGFEHVALIETDGHPLVYGDWLHAGADKPTVLIYGHYDVQPVDPLALWMSPPFEPTVRPGPHGDDLYARGAADDKGQTFIHIKAVEALLRCTGSLPVNVKVLVEGEEEAGSRAIAEYVPAHTEQLAADLCLISDTGILAPDQPVITYGLRGGWSCEITVTGPTQDLHSGMYGGATHNPNQALCELLAALHDANGRVTVPGFYDRVQELSAAERALLAQVPYDEAQLLADNGAPAAYGEPDYTVVERIGARPTLEINGMWGGFITEGFKTVIPSQAHAKISCRLVPDQDPAEIGRLVEAHLQRLAPPTIKVEVQGRAGSPAYVAPVDSPEIQWAAAAYEAVFGVTPVYKREGGGIPIVTKFQTALGLPVVLMGFGLPDDNLHAPNEKFHLPNFYKGIQTSIVFLQKLGASAEA